MIKERFEFWEEKLIKNDDIDVHNVSLTPQNVLKKIENVIRSQSKSVREVGANRNFAISPNSANIIREAILLHTEGFKEVDKVADGTMRYNPYEFAEHTSIPDDVIIFGNIQRFVDNVDENV